MCAGRKTRIQGDLIILGRVSPLQDPANLPSVAVSPPNAALDSTTLLARYAFSQALSRSTALAVLEEALEDYLSSVAQLPHSLERTGKPGLSRKALIKKLGALLKFRQGLNLNRENFSDTPDLYWAEPELESFFKSMSAALEVRARTNAVSEKITYATEVSSDLHLHAQYMQLLSFLGAIHSSPALDRGTIPLQTLVSEISCPSSLLPIGWNW